LTKCVTVETTVHWSMLWFPDSCHNSGRYNDNEDANGRTLKRTKNCPNIQALSLCQYASQQSQLERSKHLVLYKKWPDWIRSHRNQVKPVVRAGLSLETGETKCKSLDHASSKLSIPCSENVFLSFFFLRSKHSRNRMAFAYSSKISGLRFADNKSKWCSYARWLASSDVISQLRFTSEKPTRIKMASCNCNRVLVRKFLVRLAVIELLWCIQLAPREIPTPTKLDFGES